MHHQTFASLFCTLCLFVASAASATTLGGRFDDAANSALVASDLSAPRFDSPFAIANNVALYTFSVPVVGVVSVTSSGFALGGADPYLSLFAGAGGTATFVDSNYVQAFSTGGDFAYQATLPAGTYQLALGVFANMSFAENRGGTLADGFIGLGTPQSLGNAGYRIELSTPVPEPSGLVLMLAGLVALGLATSLRGTVRGPLS